MASLFGIVQCSGLLKADPRPGNHVFACSAYIKSRDRDVSVVSKDGRSVVVFDGEPAGTYREFPPLAPGVTDLGHGVIAYSVNGEVTLTINGVLTTCSQN